MNFIWESSGDVPGKNLKVTRAEDSFAQKVDGRENRSIEESQN